MTAPTPNAALAYAILDQIDAHPETWNQNTWDCETAACFAGWAVRFSGGKSADGPTDTFVVDGPEELVGLTVCDAAYAVLRVLPWFEAQPDGRCRDLFSPSNTREDLGLMVAEIFGPRPGGEGGSATDGAPC